jgi:hypothetical protein
MPPEVGSAVLIGAYTQTRHLLVRPSPGGTLFGRARRAVRREHRVVRTGRHLALANRHIEEAGKRIDAVADR